MIVLRFAKVLVSGTPDSVMDSFTFLPTGVKNMCPDKANVR